MRETQADTFRCAWWLRNPHLQTVWGRFVGSSRLRLDRESLETPDGDELIVDHAAAPASTPAGWGVCERGMTCAAAGPATTVRLLLVHGLEGSSHSNYIQRMLALAGARGWAATAINSRSCARDTREPARMLPNRRPRLYHSGETGDFDFVLRTLTAREPSTLFLAAGVSLGGNMLLKWLGENPGQRSIAAAATISVPYDLAAGAAYLQRQPGPFYVRFFLRTLKQKALALIERHPELRDRLDAAAIMRSDSFFEFDDAATAPLHGFAGAIDYYERSSSIAFAGRITTPVLCLSSLDDPFVPPEVIERFRAAAASPVQLVVTRRGGHAGFVAGAWPWNYRFWSEAVVVDWLARRANAGP